MEVLIVKIGGKLLADSDALHVVMEGFSKIAHPKILVHGGGKQVDELLEKLGHTSDMVNGRRITDKATLDICTMVYAGLIGKSLTAHLAKLGCKAMSLAGCDGNIIQAKKRDKQGTNFGEVGDIERVDAYQLCNYFKDGLIPVLSSITHDGNGNLLNTNSDTVASVVAQALATLPNYKVKLHYCFELPGVLMDVKDVSSVVKKLDRNNFEKMASSGKLSQGMIPKCQNGFLALASNVEEVTIGNLHTLLDPKLGTKLVK